MFRHFKLIYVSPGFDPSTAKEGGGGVNYPRSIFLAAISERHGTIRNAFVTFPEYGWATKWHPGGIFTPPPLVVSSVRQFQTNPKLRVLTTSNYVVAEYSVDGA